MTLVPALIRLTRETREQAAALIFDVVDAQKRAQAGPALAVLAPRPTGRTRFWAMSQQVGGAMRDLPEPVELLTTINLSGFHLFFGKTRIQRKQVGQDETVLVRQGNLADGGYGVRVDSEGFRSQIIQVTLPTSNTSNRVLLLPASSYAFDAGVTLARGVIHQWDGRGVPGVRVQADVGALPCETDTAGEWVVALQMQRLTKDNNGKLKKPVLTFTYPDDPAQPVSLALAVTPKQELTVTQTALAGRVLNAAHQPLAGVQVAVRGLNGLVSTNRSGEWALYLPLGAPSGNVQVAATAEGASQQRTQAVTAWTINRVADFIF